MPDLDIDSSTAVPLIIMGGPGRSGTTYVANCIGNHFEVASFDGVELKLFCEFGGLRDLQFVLVESFSPNRGEIAFKTIRNMMKMVRNGNYGTPALENFVTPKQLDVLIEKLFTKLMPRGYIGQLDHFTFNSAARDFLRDLATIALKQKTGSRFFLEKTPHNCLQPLFLHELAPTARYLHIYRNPKAIAVSLLYQPWGPTHLEHAIIWVQSYFESWLKARAHYERLDLPLADYRIEDIATDPETMSKKICSDLSLSVDGEIFSGANMEQLMRWKTEMPEDNYKLLDQKLDPLCEILGY